MNNAKQIFAFIQDLNPNTTCISSIGEFVTNQNADLADQALQEVLQYLPEASLAYKIASTSSRFSEKQLWVIAFELVKNPEYSAMVAEYYAKRERIANAKADAQKSKLQANKDASGDVLASVKQAGRKLADYYQFVKSNRQFAREFYSKKFTPSSVNAFLAI
jgi:hypothetical protein